MAFEANDGQATGDVRFVARAGCASVLLRPHETVFVLAARRARTDPTAALRSVARPSKPERPETARVQMRLAGAAVTAVEAGERLPGVSNYLVGSDPSRWRANVPRYASARYREVYPGVDLVFYEGARGLEYDFVLAPGADPARVAFELSGAESLRVDDAGALIARTAAGDLRHNRPLVYQKTNGARRTVAGRFMLRGPTAVGFELGAYDRTIPLVIDPAIGYDVSIDGSGNDNVAALAVDGAGNAYAVGQTFSPDLPTVGALDASLGGQNDAYVAKVDPSGNLVYLTYLGGGDIEFGAGVGVDAAGAVYVAGQTYSADFPTTAGAFQTARRGEVDAYVAKLSADGASLAYSTLLGGAGDDRGLGLAVDAAGSAYVCGQTDSADFPKAGAFQSTYAGNTDAFVAKLASTGSEFVYSSFLGGPGGELAYGVAVDARGNAYLAGATSAAGFPTASPVQGQFGGGFFDAFAAKVSASGALAFSTYLGGAGIDLGLGVAADGAENMYLTGYTESATFPTANALRATLSGPADAFVTKIATGSGAASIAASTYLGGTNGDQGFDVSVGPGGGVDVVGSTNSTDYPQVEPVQPGYGGGPADACVTRFNGALSAIAFSSYIGGDNSDFAAAVATRPGGSILVGVSSNSTAGAARQASDDAIRLVDLRFGPPPDETDVSIEIEEGTILRSTAAGEDIVQFAIKVCCLARGAHNVAGTVTLGDCTVFGMTLARADLFDIEEPIRGSKGTTIRFVIGEMISECRLFYVQVYLNKNDPDCALAGAVSVSARVNTSDNDVRPANNGFVDLVIPIQGPLPELPRIEIDPPEDPEDPDDPLEPPQIEEYIGGYLGGGSSRAVERLGQNRRAGLGSDPQAPERLRGYRVYASSQPNVQPVPENLFSTIPPNEIFADVSGAPSGSFFVVTALFDGGETGPSNEVGGVLPTLTSVTVSSKKIVAKGSGFDPATRVFVGGAEFERPAAVKSGNRKVIQKGNLRGGLSLKTFVEESLRPGDTVVITFRDPKRNAVAFVYTR